jgi:phage I-like protein
MASRNSPAEEPKMKTLLAALSLGENASEAEAFAALARIQDFTREVMTLSGKFIPAEALGLLNAWKASAAQVETLSRKVAEIEGQARKVEIETLVAKAKTEGKLAPAMEKLARDMGEKDIAMLRAFVEASPVLVQTSATQDGKTGTATLSADEQAIAKRFGLKIEDVQKRIATLSAQAQN